MALPFDLEFYQGSLGNYALIAMAGSSAVLVINAATGQVVREQTVAALPVSLAVDAPRNRVYVLTLSDLAIHDYDMTNWSLVASVPLAYDPEVQATRTGRVHMYDAGTAASAGSTACASCHTFGHMDFLAWDLGNPHGGTMPYAADVYVPAEPALVVANPFPHGGNLAAAGLTPMKGPMVTQSLRGLRDGEPFHWRGDRRFFQMFRGAFVGLQGGTGITPKAMQEYMAFVRGVEFPPNPHQNLDRTLTAQQASGDNLFHNVSYADGSATAIKCVDCHASPAAGHFRGDNKRIANDLQNMLFNVPTLRGIYEKDKLLTGFGTAPDGRRDDVRDFFNDRSLIAFINSGALQDIFPAFSAPKRDDIAAFIEAWDTGVAPLVGRTFHLDANADAAGFDVWANRAEARQQAGDLDLIVKGWLTYGGTRNRFGFLYAPAPGVNPYLSDNLGARVTRDTLMSWAASGAGQWTFFCVPRHTGRRLGIDHDNDLLTDGDERYLYNTDPDRADVDRDGYWDPQELASGSNPNVFNASVADTVPPQITAHSADGVFTDTATLHVTTNEPTTISVTVTAGGTNYTFASTQLRTQHDVAMFGLPASSNFTYSIAAMDRNNNTTQAGSTQTARTAPRLFHVENIVLSKDNSSVPNLKAVVTIADHLGNVVPGVEVRALWHSVNGGLTNPATYDQTATTDGAGIATFTAQYLPTVADTVHFSPMFVGALTPTQPYFVGYAGLQNLDLLSMLYFEPDNKKSYAKIALP
jgi:hypothetical protein